jgi:hypothetical protein
MLLSYTRAFYLKFQLIFIFQIKLVMKKILVLSCLILILIFFNYPIFDSTGISYIFIFLSFTAICFAGAKLWTSKNGKDDYESVEKETDKLYSDDGIFQYTNDGFYVNRDNLKEYVKWDEIVEVNSFNIPILHREEQRGIEVITDKNNYEFNSNNTTGIEKLTDKLYENLPNWKENPALVRINNYGLKKAKLYERNNINPTE